MPTTTDELKTVLEAFKENITVEIGEVVPMSFRINQVNQDPGITLGHSPDNNSFGVTPSTSIIFSSVSKVG